MMVIPCQSMNHSILPFFQAPSNAKTITNSSMDTLIALLATRETGQSVSTGALATGEKPACEPTLRPDATSLSPLKPRKDPLPLSTASVPLLQSVRRKYHTVFAIERQAGRLCKLVEGRSTVTAAPSPQPAETTESPNSGSSTEPSSHSPHRTGAVDNSKLLQELGNFEARKQLALQRMRSSDTQHVGVTAQELRVVHFLAAVDHGEKRPSTSCTVDTRNLRLRWLLNPSAYTHIDAHVERRRSPCDTKADLPSGTDGDEGSPHAVKDRLERSDASMSDSSSTVVGALNLLTMPTDVFVRACGKPSPKDLDSPLLDSPRSVVVCLRNGVQPMDLQEVPFDMAVLQWSSEGGYTMEMIRERHRFHDLLRRTRLESLRAEYTALCEKLPTEVVQQFFEFVALNDGLQAPALVPVFDDNGSLGAGSQTHLPVLRYEVRVSGDPKATEAMRKIEEKSRHDREKLTTILRQEISTATKKAEAFAEERRRNTVKELAHRREMTLKAQERERAAAERKQEAEQKSQRRTELVEAAVLRRKEEVDERQRRAELQEAISQQAVAARAAQRRARHEAKQSAQMDRLRQADLRLQTMEEERRDRFAEKERLRDALLRQKQLQHELKRQRDEEINQRQQERRRDIAWRASELIAERQQRAQECSAIVEARLERFAQEKRMHREMKHLIDLRRELNREEVFQESERKQQETVSKILERRQAHEASFDAFRDAQEGRRRQMKNQDVQLLLIKEMELSRHEQLRSFELLLAAEACERKRAKGEQLEDARHREKVVLEQERESLHQLRRKALQQADNERIEGERTQYFEVVGATDPSDADLLKLTNARHVARMKASLGRTLTAEEASLIQRRCVSSTSERAASPLPDISAIRPASSQL